MDHSTEFAAQFVCDAPDDMPDSLRDRLDVLSCLSEKPTRAVYLCRDRLSGEKVILKLTQQDSPDSVSREHALLQKLDNTAIPRALLYDSDDTGREYLLRTYAEGETLDRLIGRDGPFDERGTLDIIKKLCGILAYLHKQSPPIIYRDIKPQNIVVTPNGKVSLIDFGISREERGDKDFDTVYVGSVAFAAPEQFGFTKTDSRSDVFALGKLALYLCTGQTALPGFKTLVSSKKLARLIAKCTELSPERRYASVQQLSRSIDRVLNPPTRKELLAGGLAALLVICAGLALTLLPGNQETVIPPELPILADGSGFEDEVKIPVLIETKMNGRPFSDCAVAVDNHHWFVPAENGRAELTVYEYDEYRARAAYMNQTAYQLLPVTRPDGPVSVTFDFADVPTAPEYIPLTLPFGESRDISLGVAGADEVTLTGQPEGIAVITRDGAFYLTVDEGVASPGHYTIFMESANESGKADTVLSILLEEPRRVIGVSTAEELMAISGDLSAHYVLENDIDLSGIAHWTPIGSDEYPFTGIFDGGGHTITGITYNELSGEAASYVGLFGVVTRGVIRGVIVENADLSLSNQSANGFAVLAGRLGGGLVESCAVLGGRIYANIGLESSCGGLVGINTGIIRNSINTAEVTIYTAGIKDRTECYAGGICGMNSGYIEYCGNLGDITGISIAGGVAGINDMGILTRCYNAGAVSAPLFASEYEAGGVTHLVGRGKSVSYCAFETGTAPVGATVFNGGTLLGIVPLERAGFADLDALGRTLHISDARDRWAYSDTVPGYPVPSGIFDTKDFLEKSD